MKKLFGIVIEELTPSRLIAGYAVDQLAGRTADLLLQLAC